MTDPLGHDVAPATTRLATAPGPGDQTRPLLEAAQREARALLNGDAAAAGTVVAALGYFGLSTATQSYVLGLLGLAAGIVTYGSTVYAQAQAAYRVWRDAERDVTPTARPRAADGTPLVPAGDVL